MRGPSSSAWCAPVYGAKGFELLVASVFADCDGKPPRTHMYLYGAYFIPVHTYFLLNILWLASIKGGGGLVEPTHPSPHSHRESRFVVWGEGQLFACDASCFLSEYMRGRWKPELVVPYFTLLICVNGGCLCLLCTACLTLRRWGQMGTRQLVLLCPESGKFACMRIHCTTASCCRGRGVLMCSPLLGVLRMVFNGLYGFFW